MEREEREEEEEKKENENGGKEGGSRHIYLNWGFFQERREGKTDILPLNYEGQRWTSSSASRE